MLRADASEDGRLSLVRLDVLNCRAGEAEPDLKQLLDPYLSESARSSAFEFIATPRVARTSDQERQLGVLQSKTFGSRQIRVQFGAQPIAEQAARRTIWIDSVAVDSREEPVPDPGLQTECALHMSAARGKGYCDMAREQASPCELDATTRSRYRERVAAVASRALSAWREAVRTLIRERKLNASKVSPEQMARALLGVLPQASNSEPALPTSSVKRGVTGLEIAAEAAIEWHDMLIGHVESLFDADLAALVVALRAPEEISAAVYVERMRHRLDDAERVLAH
jgi:hypothetical protein